MHAIDTDYAHLWLTAGSLPCLVLFHMPREYIILTSELVGKSDIIPADERADSSCNRRLPRLDPV
jgi:hypothetical protein